MEQGAIQPPAERGAVGSWCPVDVDDEKAGDCRDQCDFCRLSERHASEMRRMLQEQQNSVSRMLDEWLEQMKRRTQPTHLSGKGVAPPALPSPPLHPSRPASKDSVGVEWVEEVMPRASPPKVRKSRLPVLPALKDAGGPSQGSDPVASYPIASYPVASGAGSPSSAGSASSGEEPKRGARKVKRTGEVQVKSQSVRSSEGSGWRKTVSNHVGRSLGFVAKFGSRLSHGDETLGHHNFKYNLKLELLSSLMLLLDAICIGYQLDESLRLGYEQHNSNDAALRVVRPTHWQLMEVCFVSYYTLELGVRGVTERTAFLFGPGRFWNLFDLFSVVVSIVGVLLATGGSSKIPRLLRMAKGLRVLRAMRFSGSLRAMVFAIASSLKPLFWALCVLFLIMYFFTVVFVTAIADAFERTPVSNDSGPDVGAFFPYYRTLWDTTLYLFMSITGGIDWQTMALPLSDVDPVLMYVFAIYICFMVFGVLNVVVGIFVSTAKEAVDHNRDILTENRLREQREAMMRMRNVFREADTDGDNTLSWDEFSEYLADTQTAVFFSSLGLDVNVAQALFVLLDVDDDGSVNIDEFVHGCLRLKGDARSIDVNMLLYQSEKMQHQFMECMDSLGRELSRLAAALNLSPCEVATEKVRKSVQQTRGLAALVKNIDTSERLSRFSRPSRDIKLIRGGTSNSMASQGSGFIRRVVRSASRPLAGERIHPQDRPQPLQTPTIPLDRNESTPVQPVDECPRFGPIEGQ